MIKATTIAAIASGRGIGGIGVIRISGSASLAIAQALSGNTQFTPRYAHFAKFHDHAQQILDEGLILYFKAPNSFTGEDVVELQGHGGPIVLNRVLKRVYALGAVPAKAGEFSERAFLNGKLDLIQAEAIHDLITSQSEAQAKAAINSLSGSFSAKVQQLLQQFIALRVYVEASIDFSEEDIDFIKDGHVLKRLNLLYQDTLALLQNANQGQLLTDGLQVVLAGKPNAGKSSLLNALSGEERAIVTDIAGTTRDVLKETILIDGIPLHILDTAGLRETTDHIEQEGIKRAHNAIKKADLILWIHDDRTEKCHQDPFLDGLAIPIIHVHNKSDLSHKKPGLYEDYIALSAKTAEGIPLLKEKILSTVNFNPMEGLFSARERHLNELTHTLDHIQTAIALLKDAHHIELVAEEIRLGLNALGNITGEFTTEALLGEIFSNFCIGK